MKTVILSLLVTFSVQALAQNAIQYRPIELFKEDPTRGNRAEWDITGRFCYVYRGTTDVNCSVVVQLGEVKVRDGGNWSQDPADQFYISKLSPKAIEVASKYKKLYIRYIGLGDGYRFTLHSFSGGDTLFAFGALKRGAVTGAISAVVDSFSYSPGDTQTAKPKSADATGVLLDAAIKADPNSDIVNAMMSGVAEELIVAQEVATIHVNTNPQPVVPTNTVPLR